MSSISWLPTNLSLVAKAQTVLFRAQQSISKAVHSPNRHWQPGAACRHEHTVVNDCHAFLFSRDPFQDIFAQVRLSLPLALMHLSDCMHSDYLFAYTQLRPSRTRDLQYGLPICDLWFAADPCTSLIADCDSRSMDSLGTGHKNLGFATYDLRE